MYQRNKKISYASSFGRLSLPEDEKQEVKKYLESYDAISLREESGVKLVEQLGVNGAVHVLDPTLQMNSDFGISILKSPRMNIMCLFTNLTNIHGLMICGIICSY